MLTLRFYTGPTIVKQIAEKMREASINVTSVGTEHVCFTSEKGSDFEARYEAVRLLKARHGTDFGLWFSWK